MSWPPPGQRLLPREVAKVVYEAGWKDARNCAIMIAVCQQESQFYVEAVGPPNSNGTVDYGLFQINSGHWSKFGYASQDALRLACFDPPMAAKLARQLYLEAGGFQPWVAYTSGSYKKFLGTACVGTANFLAGSFGLPMPYVVIGA